MDAKTKLKNGWLHVLVTLEVIGKPKEHLESALQQLVDTIKKEERIETIGEHLEPAHATEDGFYSAFAEIDMLVKNMETLTWLASNYTPASIEVIEPLSFTFSAGDIQNWYNDVLNTMHTIGFAHKSQQAEFQFLRGQLRALIENALLLSLSRSAKTIPQLIQDTSIDKEAVEGHLKLLVDAKKVMKKKGEKGVYQLK